MSTNSNCENWCEFIPVPVYDDKPEYFEFYLKAWEIAYSHIRHIDGMPQTPYMDEAFCDTKVELKLKNINIKFRDDCDNTDIMNACNYENISLENVNIVNVTGDSVIRTWSNGNISIKNCKTDSGELVVKKSAGKFKTDWI